MLTTAERLLSSDHRLHLLCDEEGAAGILKVATKHLFYVVCSINVASIIPSHLAWIQDREGAYIELDALCVMDFYVSSRCQRQGVGIKLFNIMLKAEGKEAKSLAFDKPSSKMLPFLTKHFNLTSFVEQPNRFV